MRTIAGSKYSTKQFDDYAYRVRFCVIGDDEQPRSFDVYTDDTIVDNVIDVIGGIFASKGKETIFEFAASKTSDDACANMIAEMFSSDV